MNILNHSNEPTFTIQNRKEITNLTLGFTLMNVMYIRSAPSVRSQTHMPPNRWHRTTVTIWGHKRVTWESDNDDEDDLKANTEAHHEVS
jgi:hypothetical protein